MSEEREQHGEPGGDEPQSMEAIAALDAYLDDLVADRGAVSRDLGPQEQEAFVIAAQLRLAREGVEQPSAAFLARLEREVAGAVPRAPERRKGLSRGGFLRSMATLAGGAGLGVAAVGGAAAIRDAGRPSELVAAGNGRWYDIAAVDELQDGGSKPFAAGGVLGYLLKDGGQLHAVSAICTHMGCRLKPARDGRPGLQCLCHGSRFSRRGEVEQGLAPAALPAIELKVENGRVYALGTLETV
jgi:Rieske Fe-S protein